MKMNKKFILPVTFLLIGLTVYTTAVEYSKGNITENYAVVKDIFDIDDIPFGNMRIDISMKCEVDENTLNVKSTTCDTCNGNIMEVGQVSRKSETCEFCGTKSQQNSDYCKECGKSVVFIGSMESYLKQYKFNSLEKWVLARRNYATQEMMKTVLFGLSCGMMLYGVCELIRIKEELFIKKGGK